MNKVEIQNELKKALALLSRIPVVGDSVDAMAAAKAKIRSVCAEVEKIGADEQKGGDQHGD